MPNHVENDLTITGTKENIKKFLDFASSEKKIIDENKFVPYPKHFEEMDRKTREWENENKDNLSAKWSERPMDGYNQGGYEWCNDNWGTKWGLYDFSPLTVGRTNVKITFLTAWSPAVPIYKKMAEMFPELKFKVKYYEAGAGYQGTFEAKEGIVIRDETRDYNGPRGG